MRAAARSPKPTRSKTTSASRRRSPALRCLRAAARRPNGWARAVHRGRSDRRRIRGTGLCGSSPPPGNTLQDAVILATGAPRAVPDIAGVTEFEGRGVSYCAVCDAFFYRGKAVAVLGQGEYALEEARVLLPVAGAVTLLTNGSEPPAGLPDGPCGGHPAGRRRRRDGQGRTHRVLCGRPRSPRTACSSPTAPRAAATLRASWARKLDGNKIRTDAGMATAVPVCSPRRLHRRPCCRVAKAVADGAQAAMSAMRFVRK